MSLDKIKHYFLIGFILLCPLIYTSGVAGENSLRELQESFFQYGAICFISFFIGNIWLSAFICLNVFLYIYAGQEIGSMQVLNVFIGSMLFLISRNFFAKNKFETYSKYVLWVAIISIAWMNLQLWGIDPLFHGQTAGGQEIAGPFKDAVGFFAIKMASATYLNLALPILAAMNIWIAPLLFIPILLSASSSCVLATGVVSLFYTFFLHRKAFFMLLVITPIAIGGYLYHDYKWDKDGTTFTSRFPVWHATFAYALKNPLGYGPDSFRNHNRLKRFDFACDYGYNLGVSYKKKDGEELFQFYSPSNDSAEVAEKTAKVIKDGFRYDELTYWDNPHNFFLQILFQYGFLGVFLLFGLLREMYYRFRFAMKDKELIVITSCLLVYLITGLTHFPLELARTAYLAPLLLGAFYSKTDSRNAV